MATPKYQVIADRIRSEILNGTLSPLDQLPTEHEMSEIYGVSRGTIRTALGELSAEGLVRSAQGSGSYVSAASPMTRYFSLSSFDDDMRAAGRTPSTEVLAAERLPAAEGDPLNVRPGTPLIRLRRLRLADGRPMAVEERRIVESLCPGLLGEDLAHQSVHWLLTVKYAIPLVRIEHAVERGKALPEDARTLNIKPGAPVLTIERLTYTQDAEEVRFPAVWFRSVHRDHQPNLERTSL
ncbi:MAG: GntR family transcriptional regulator [Acidimicrobiia bacterium]|nr:GntR family transcriptional regulator [Acidimicrobiia bacterium]